MSKIIDEWTTTAFPSGPLKVKTDSSSNGTTVSIGTIWPSGRWHGITIPEHDIPRLSAALEKTVSNGIMEGAYNLKMTVNCLKKLDASSCDDCIKAAEIIRMLANENLTLCQR